jgi:hypothetical protein
MYSDHVRCFLLVSLSFGPILGCGPRTSDDATTVDSAGGWEIATEPSTTSQSSAWEIATDQNNTASTFNQSDPFTVEPTDSSETATPEVTTPQTDPFTSQPIDLFEVANFEATPSGETTAESGDTVTAGKEPEPSLPTPSAEPTPSADTPSNPIPSAARFAGVWKTELTDDGSGAGIVAGKRYELVLSDTSNSLEQKIDGRFVIYTETTRAGWWALTIVEAVVDSMGGGGVDAADAPGIIFLPELTVTGSTANVIKEGWFGRTTRYTFRIDESDPNVLHAECSWIKGLESLPFRRQ